MSPSVQVVLSGASGRMGRTLSRLAADDDRLEILGGIDRDADAACDVGCPRVVEPGSAGELIRTADVLIDFSAPAFLERILETHREALRGTALVVGTTGLEAPHERLLDAAAEHAPVLLAANFSVGVNLLLALAEETARVLGVDYDVELVEAHHRRKEDAPSGTALALGEAVARGRDVSLSEVRRDGRSGRPGARPSGEIGFHALRGGDVVGEHQVMFIGERERIELAHVAQDRALFAEGALRAARWLVTRPPGRYSMRDVLGLGRGGPRGD